MYRRQLAPYGVGNRHPQFLGWVHGGGTAVGMLAEMLAAGLNANCGGRDHAPIACERQVIRWASEMLGLPAESSGLVLSGTSMANFVAVMIARAAALGERCPANWRRRGRTDRLCIGRCAHVRRAGLRHGRFRFGCAAADPVRRNERNERGAFAATHRGGPGGRIATVSCCRLPPEASIPARSTISPPSRTPAPRSGCGFMSMRRFGAIAMLSPKLRGLFAGMERADSVAFDFHKWAQVPYDAGCIVVRDTGRASCGLRAGSRIPATRRTRPGGGRALAGRSWTGTVARLPGAQGLDDVEDVWRRPYRTGYGTKL